jgi:hypothetical protein
VITNTYSFDDNNTFKEMFSGLEMVIEGVSDSLPVYSYTCDNLMNCMTNLFSRGNIELKGGLKK